MKILVVLVGLYISSYRGVVIVDRETSEELVGVSVKCCEGEVYSDMDGRVYVSGDSLRVSYPSYESIDVVVGDTIRMSHIE